jgi:hypothetical protein
MKREVCFHIIYPFTRLYWNIFLSMSIFKCVYFKMKSDFQNNISLIGKDNVFTITLRLKFMILSTLD